MKQSRDIEEVDSSSGNLMTHILGFRFSLSKCTWCKSAPRHKVLGAKDVCGRPSRRETEIDTERERAASDMF